MLENAQSYLGQSNIGTNSSDTGECVGLYNKVVLNVSGILYPIQGASCAKDLLTAKNTRPDLFQQIKNNPNDPNQLPQIGDWVVWGSTWGGGYGHVACVKTVDKNSFTSIEQNFVYHKVTEQWHDWNGVIGWIRYTAPQPVDPCADVKSQLAAAQTTINQQKSQIDQLNATIATLNQQVNDKQKEIDELADDNAKLKQEIESLQLTIEQKDKEIAQLKEQIASGATVDITINFNFWGQLFWNLIKLIGTKGK